MKKIYILTAIFALLTLSLNAQIILTEWTYPSSFPTSWGTPAGAGSVGGYYFGGSSGADIVIPTDDLQGNSTVNVKVTAAKENTDSHTISVNGTNSSPDLTTSLVELTWENVNASSGITIHVSDWYVNISEIHVYAMVTDPLINASPNSLSMSAAPGGTSTEMVTVAGYNLTGNITASISGDAVFSVDPTSLGTNGGSLTVTYSPSSPGNHTATLTLTSNGAEAVTITLDGSCVAATTYELVTDPSTQLVDGEKYIIVHDNYAMGALSGTSSLAPSVTITNNGDGTVSVPGNVNPMVLTLHDYSNSYNANYKYTFTRDDGAYLMALGGNSNATYLTTNSTAIDNASWRTVADVKSTGGYGIQCYRTTSRAIAYQTSGARFGNYATSNITANGTTYYYGLLYREVSNTPKIEITPETQTINDAAAGTLTVTGTNIEGNINVSVANTTDWYLDPTSFTSTGGNASVSYTGRALSASTTVTAEAANDNTVTDEATVNYEPDLYIYCDNGASPWNFSGNPAVAMTNNGDGTYTATLQDIPANSHILFGRASGLTYGWEGDANRLFIGAVTDGADWGYGTNTSGNLDTDPTNDNPVKYHPIHFPEGGTYTVTIDANAGTFTITKLIPTLTVTPTSVDVGTNSGAGTSANVTVSGENLTQDLTVSVTGDGFSVSPTSITAADAIAGTTVTVTYNGTTENATGTLTIGNNQVSVTVDLTATYVAPVPVLTAPENGSTVNVGTNTGSGVSKTINIKGENLTQDLTVSVSGDGFNVSRDVTVTAAEANAGQDITVTYNGTNANATGELTITSGEIGTVTVHLTATYSDNGEITVAEGTTTNMFLPVYGSYYEQVQMNQMIYPASMLSDMEGKYITSMTFYTASGTTSGGDPVSGIMFSGGKVMLSLGSTSNSSFTSNAAISADVTQVAEINDVQQDANLTAWTFTFDTPYLYEGGNLLVQVDTEAGSYYRTFFYGTTMSNMGRHQCTQETALDNFLPKATFTYTSNAPVVPAVEGGLLRLHLLFCDQLKASIPEDNSHPDAYGYILKFEPEGGETKESGEVRVNIQKTDCEVMGYYTLDQIDRDTDRGLTMDVLTADVEYDLSNTNDLLNYYYLQGAESAYPRLDEDYLSKLYRQEDFTYREMYEDSHEFNEVFNSGEHHYFNSAAEPVIGEYGNPNLFMSYAPSVTTWGVQRRYYELDMKDNTYGGPIWKTAVGQAKMGLDPNQPDDKNYKPIVEFQEGWNTSWKDANGVGSNLYMLDNINALGYLPPKNLTKVEFEPYMFRVFVESDNGKLRPYKFVKDDNGNDVITAGEGSTNGPICVWSGYIKRDGDGNIINDPENGVTVDRIGADGPYTYTKMKVDRTGGSDADPLGDWDKDENNAIFGALDDLLITGYTADGKPILRTDPIPEEDLRIFVRFYFSVKGEAADHTIWTRSEGSRSGNGAESPGSAAGSIATAVKEVAYHGEVVGQTYYNIQGMESDQPFDGVNIVVTRYSDGATSISKVIR